MIAGALLMIVGTQVVALGLCAHAYGTYFMGEKDPWFDRMRARFRLEHGLLLGGAVVARRPRRRRRDRRHLDRPRLRRARPRSASRSLAATLHDRRHPDLLLVVPAQHPRPAPAVRTGAAEARQLRKRVLSANRAGLRLPHEEAIRLLAPGPIGSRSVRPEQVADAVLAHHGLVASPRLATSERVDLVHIGLSRVLAFQGAVSVAVCAGVLGFVLRPVYGMILFIAGMASTAVLWTAPRPLSASFRSRCLGVDCSVSQSVESQLPLRLSASFYRFAPTTRASALRRAFSGRVRCTSIDRYASS